MNITSPRQLIHALPSLVGTIGPDSVLLVELSDGQIHSNAHISHVSSAEGLASIDRSVHSLNAGENTSLVALAFTQNEELATSSLKMVQSCADQNGIHILDLLHVFGSQWRSILCLDEECCPKTGNPVDSAEFDGHVDGRRTDELPVAEFQLRARTLDQKEQQARDEAFASGVSWPLGDPRDLYEYRDTTVTEVMRILTRSMDTLRRGFWNDAACVGKALLDIRSRDGVLRRILDDEHHREIVSHNLVLLYCVVPIEYRPTIATVFAGARWLEGDRITTRHAIDVALEENSEYSLARLLDTALIHAVPHRVWFDSLSAVSYEKCLAGAA